MPQPAVFRIKKLGDTTWIFPDGGDAGKEIKFTVSAVSGAKADKHDLNEGAFRLKFTGADVEVSVDTSFSLYTNDNRKQLREAFDTFIQKLDDLEADNSLANGAARLIAQTTAQYLPLPLAEVPLYHYNMVNPFLYPFIDGGQTYTDVLPGMRLQVYYSNFYREPELPKVGVFGAYGGTGNDTIHVSASAKPSVVSFDPFLENMKVTEPLIAGNKSRVASGVVDLMADGEVKAYNRLIYPTNPNRIRAINVPDYDPANNTVLVRAASYQELTQYTLRPDLRKQVPGVITQFFGRAELVPEISVRVNGAQEYVPVGGTLKQLVEREMQSIHRPKSLKFMRRINQFQVALTFDDPAIGYNMFLVQGDDISW